MNYRHVYMLIIEHAKSEMKNGLRPKTKGQYRWSFKDSYFEFHHVLPKSLFPNWVSKKFNLVSLTPREHFFCHELLTKIYPCPETYGAVWFMSSSGRWKCSSREYERIKKHFSSSMKGHHRNLGWKPTVSTRKKMSDSRKRFLESRGEYHFYNNGSITVQSHECPPGFSSGMLFKDIDSFKENARKSHIGLVWWNNGETSIQSKTCPGDGFKRGRLNTLSEDAKESIRQKLKKLNQEKPMVWYNDGVRNYRIRKGDTIPENLVKGKLPRKS